MGNEAECTLRLGSRKDRGRALLETDFLLFRGEERVKIPFSEMTRVSADAGILSVEFAKKTAKFELGRLADKWAAKILRPKGRIEKLGVKADASVALVGKFDDAFRAELAAAARRVSEGATGRAHDHVFFAAEAEKDLARIGKLAALLAPAGGVWVVYPKGRKDIREADVLAAGRAAGLKDVKVARFSETHTALRFVVPLAKRKSD